MSDRWALPPFEVPPEPPPTETLVQALDEAYRSSPTLQARRYDLRSADEDYAIALAETRPTSEIDINGGYSQTVPGRITNSQRSFVDQLSSAPITSNTGSAQLVVNQPITTGGQAAADREVAIQAVGAGRAQLRGTEGDLFLQVVTSYADVRRDSGALALRGANLKQLEATLDEVKARQEAGELTRTDIAQAETQLDLARAQYNSAVQQLQEDRATYAATVGHDAGVLAPEPNLPFFPRSIDDAFDTAARLNPELAQAIDTERSSRARIAAAAAQSTPKLSLRGTGVLTAQQLLPFHSYNADRGFSGEAVLTIPLTNGGRVGALIAQARDRNASDRLQIEATRRGLVQAIVTAWNAVAVAERNLQVELAEVAAAKVLNEGTFEEYRAGLRSTFDVLFAQGSLRDAETALVSSRHDLYVAQAALLRRMGVLEAKTLLTGTSLYDPSVNLRHAERRSALPWGGVVRAIDRLDERVPAQGGIEQPAIPIQAPRLAPGQPAPEVAPTDHSPEVPIPGTAGVQQSASTLKRP